MPDPGEDYDVSHTDGLLGNAIGKIKSTSCWVFHGAKDDAVPLARSEEMVAALKKAGGEPKFTVYPEAGHDSWTESYNNPELYTWLLSQQRTAK